MRPPQEHADYLQRVLTDTRVLSVWQPWAWALIYAGKDVENRRRRMANPPPKLLIHAGLQFDEAAVGFMRDLGIDLPDEAYEGGHIVGMLDPLACVRDSNSPWAIDGYWHWCVGNPVPASRPIPYTGRQNLSVPPDGWTGHFPPITIP